MKLAQYIYKNIYDLQIEQNTFINNEDNNKNIKNNYKYYIIDLLYLFNKKYKLYRLSRPSLL